MGHYRFSNETFDCGLLSLELAGPFDRGLTIDRECATCDWFGGWTRGSGLIAKRRGVFTPTQ